MEQKTTEETINELIETLKVEIEPELMAKYEIMLGDDDNKALSTISHYFREKIQEDYGR